jgi:hypothetical protein
MFRTSWLGKRPVNVQPGPEEQFIGDIKLRIRRDASVCRLIAKEGYDGDLGIRSMINAVRDLVELSLEQSYLAVNKLIEERQEAAEYLLDVRNKEIAITAVGVQERDDGDEDDEDEQDNEGDRDDGEDDEYDELYG